VGEKTKIDSSGSGSLEASKNDTICSSYWLFKMTQKERFSISCTAYNSISDIFFPSVLHM